MTARMEGFFQNHDEQVIREVGRMAELGYIDKEFSVYGCAYWQDGTRHYLTSRCLEKVLVSLEQQAVSGNMVTLPHMVQRISSVPLGEDARMIREVKRQTARELQQAYSEDYLAALAHLAGTPANDGAYELLESFKEEIDGYFDRDLLCLFDGLVDMTYSAKVLTEKHFTGFKTWLSDINHQLREESIVHDIFHKTFYTIAVVFPNGRVKIHTNAQRERILERRIKLIGEGALVTPIFAKTWGYNYEYNLLCARKDHDKLVPFLLDTGYMDKVRTLHALPTAIDITAYNDLAAHVLAVENALQADTLRYYGHLWHAL